MFAYLLCLLFVLQAPFTLFVQQLQLKNIASNLPADIELICTGSDMKWVSISLTEQYGKFVFVDTPEDIDPETLTQSCPDTYLAQLELVTGPVGPESHTDFRRFKAPKQPAAQAFYTTSHYLTPLSRAPPVV